MHKHRFRNGSAAPFTGRCSVAPASPYVEHYVGIEFRLLLCVTAMRSEIFIYSWAVARIKIARVILAIRLDWNWSSFQLASSAPPLSVTDSAIAPSARIVSVGFFAHPEAAYCAHPSLPKLDHVKILLPPDPVM